MTDNEPSFEGFLEAHWARLFRTAYLLTGQRADAEDLLQAALAKVCVSWPKIRDKAAAEAYTRQTLVRLAQRRWRDRDRWVPTEEVPGLAEDHLAVRADHLALWAEVRRLPDRMRAAVVLRYFEDLSVEETARVLGCSQGAVKSQTHHALRRLRAALPSFDLTEELS